jgi:cytochrome c oxidase subunit IV
LQRNINAKYFTRTCWPKLFVEISTWSKSVLCFKSTGEKMKFAIVLMMVLIAAGIYINTFLIKGNDFETLIVRFIIMVIFAAGIVMTFLYHNTLHGF